MTSATMRLQMVMELADRLSAPMQQVTRGTERFNREVSESQQRLDELGNTRQVLDRFRQLRQRTDQTSTALEEAQRETAEVAREFNRTTTPTTALTRRMQEATEQTRALQRQHIDERQELQQLRLQLQEAGVSTRNLDHATLSLQRRTDRYNRELEEQQRQIARTQEAQDRLNRLQQRNSDLKSKLVGDTAKLGGAIYAAKKLTDAYADVASAKGEIASLGIGVEGQNAIAEAARQYSNQWSGTTQAEFIRASYDIKSGISSLGDAAVGEFTKIAALTGGATKSSTAEMTSLFASGYAIYRKQFDGFAKTYIADWEKLSAEEKDIKFGEMLSSGISSSVQAFKTEGPKVAQAISTLGDTATSAGASMAEQFAVLGMLSASKEGGEAATKYKRFIEKAGAAGEKLGISFLDANNNLLPTIDILKRIKQHYGDLDDLDKQEITTAFGSSEAKDFVEKFIPLIDELDQSIGKMQTNLQGGMATTNKMASDILLGGPNESFNQMGNRFNNLAVMVGEIFAPALMGVVDVLGIVAIGAQELINTFPMASKFILYGAGAFVALKMAIIAGRTAMLAWNAANMLSLTTTNAHTAATSRMGIIQTALTAKTAAITAAQWLWNAALTANPIGLVIVAVGALIGLAAYLIDDWNVVWDFFKNLWASMKEMAADAWQWIQDSIIGPILAIKDALGAAWNKLFGDDEKTVEVTQKVKQISDQANHIAKDNPSVAKKIVQPKPLSTQSGIHQNNHYQVTINIDKPNASPDEINRAVAKAMDDHQRKNARSIRGNLHD
ncbi:phage tail tape measure protein [Zooshikella marina]|uniref:phage tail tape measure protein n=1 Tax=Zooshikella ganghwensis TaxID=202772 RepID=UPI001BB0524E|nr:phage tail tape measure protein [Zooshikella ganghwensis]MBU2708815.1 phage tail tape measure protein [Zooshikella ganghwensis]